MAVPTIRFRTFPISTATTAIDSEAERKGTITGESVVSTGSGNELDFGDIDISGGAADSPVKMLAWDVTADGGNTKVETFKMWLSTNGFDQAGTVIKFRAISGTDNAAPSLTENYVADAVTTSYTFEDLPEAEPGAINVYPSDEGTEMSLSTTSDDVVMAAMYAAIADNETTGTYKGLDVGYELQFSFKYSYS